MLALNAVKLVTITTRTLKDLEALQTKTFTMCALIGIGAMLLAAALSQAVKYEGGNRPADPQRRRVILYGVMLASAAGVFAYNAIMVAPTVAKNLIPRFNTMSYIGFAITLVVYFVSAFAMSKIFSTGKLASWFPTKS
jgi:sulfoxide reductase heme-binding subunit YedZ